MLDFLGAEFQAANHPVQLWEYFCVDVKAIVDKFRHSVYKKPCHNNKLTIFIIIIIIIIRIFLQTKESQTFFDVNSVENSRHEQKPSNNSSNNVNIFIMNFEHIDSFYAGSFSKMEQSNMAKHLSLIHI